MAPRPSPDLEKNGKLRAAEADRASDAPIAGHTVARDLETVEAGIRRRFTDNWKVEPLQGGDPRDLFVETSAAKLGRVLVAENATTGYRVHGHAEDDLLVGLVLEGRTEATVERNDRHLYSPGGPIGLSRGQAADVTYLPGVRAVLLRVDGQALDAHAAAVWDSDGTPKVVPPGCAVVPPGGLGRGLEDLVGLVAREAKRGGGLLAVPSNARRLEDLLLGTLFEAANFEPPAALRRRLNASVAPWQVARAEAYMREHADGEVSMADVARAVGVSLRSIESGFKRFRETTPREFLTDLRLENARARLLAAPPGSTVTAIALACGFGHHGRFAERYKTRYGEPPSATLARARA